MQEEVTQKTIAFSIKSAKLTIQVLQAAARKFLETQNKGPAVGLQGFSPEGGHGGRNPSVTASPCHLPFTREAALSVTADAVPESLSLLSLRDISP